jgi:methylglutaconyl-CoA hydratase
MSSVDIKVKNRIGYVTLNRPEKRNALSEKLVNSLHHGFSIMMEDPDVKVVVLQSVGDVFSAGADLKYLKKLQENSFEDNLDDSNKLKELLHFIYSFQKPVIAKVQGHAIAGGCGLATVCDFVVSADDAKFGYSEVKLGFIPALVMVFLLRKIGESHANKLLLTGDLVTASEAHRIGLVNEVMPREELDTYVDEMAGRIVQQNASLSMKLTKEMIKSVPQMDLVGALNYAAKMNATARSTDECKIGIEAFLNKEKMDWSDQS